MNLDTTKRLLQLTTDLHSLNNKLYQLKITREVFVIVSQNELDNLLSQCKIREDYQPVFLL